MGVTSNIQEEKPKEIEPLNEIDVDQLPYKQVENKEIYLIKLLSKKLKITDNHLSNGIKPTDEDNMKMTRINIEIEEQLKNIFHNKKLRKKHKISLNPNSHAFKYDEIKQQIEIADYQWESLNGEHEEYKKLVKEKRKQDNFIKLRGLHRQDLFYPDEEDKEDKKPEIQKNNDNYNNYYQNQNNEEDEAEEEEEN